MFRLSSMILILSLTGVACSPFRAALPPASDVQAAQDQATPGSDDAYIESQNMTDEGEDLLEPDSFDQARDKFQKALQIDPTNFRAKFYIEILKPLFASQGFLARIKPFYFSLPNGSSRYTTLVEQTLNGSDSRFRRFFLEGPEDVHTVEEVQENIDTIILSLENLRVFLHSSQVQELRLRRVPAFFGSFNPDGTPTATTNIAKCSGNKFGPIKIDLGFCGTGGEVALNRADFEVLQLGVALYEAEFTLFNAYTFNPKLINAIAEQNAKQHANDQDPQITPERRAAEIKDLQHVLDLVTSDGFGRLRRTQKIGAFEDVAQGVKIALFYFLDNQKDLCREGYFTTRNRPGYLISEGLCNLPVLPGTPNGPVNTANLLESVLLGQPLTPALTNPGDNGPSWGLDVLTLIRRPPPSLSFKIAPSSSSIACPSIDVALSDSVLAPYMVSGNAADVFTNHSSKCSVGAAP